MFNFNQTYENISWLLTKLITLKPQRKNLLKIIPDFYNINIVNYLGVQTSINLNNFSETLILRSKKKENWFIFAKQFIKYFQFLLLVDIDQLPPKRICIIYSAQMIYKIASEFILN